MHRLRPGSMNCFSRRWIRMPQSNQEALREARNGNARPLTLIPIDLYLAPIGWPRPSNQTVIDHWTVVLQKLIGDLPADQRQQCIDALDALQNTR